MYEIRLHGLGGEGVVLASELLGKTAMKQGKFSHSFPFFGTDIRGGVVKAFTRIDDKKISIKSYIYRPDIILLFNDILLNDPDVTLGASSSTLMIVNTRAGIDSLRQCTAAKQGAKVLPIDATELGYKIFQRPIFNVILLGALLRIREVVAKDVLVKVISEELPERVVQGNLTALEEGYCSMEGVLKDEASVVS